MAKFSKQQLDRQKLWEQKISRAKEVRKKWRERFRVDLAREYFDGVQNPGYPQNEWITINKIYSHLKSQLPSLYSTDPYFYMNIKRSFNPDPAKIQLYDMKAKIRQSYLNYLKDEMKLKQKARLGIFDAHFMYGVLKVYYMADERPHPQAGQDITDESGSPMIGDDNQVMTYPEYIPVNERYMVSRVHPDDFLFGEDSGTLEEEWDWVCQIIRKPYEEVKDDPRFDKKAVKSLEKKGGETKDDADRQREDRKKGGDIKGPTERDIPKNQQEKVVPKVVCYYEIYNLKKNKWLVVADGADIPLIDEEDLPKGIEKHPYAYLTFTQRDDSPYPIPPVSQMLDCQKEYCLTRSRMVTHRKRFNRKYEVDITRFEDPDMEISKLESGDDGAIIRKTGSEDCVTPIKDAPLDQQTTIQELAIIGRDLIEVGGGSTDEARGIAGADSATQAGILDRRLEVKEGDALSMVIDWITEVARKLDMLVQTHITKDEAIKISGPEGEYWAIIKPDDYEDIPGEYEYSVDVGSTLPKLPQMERSSWMAFLQLLAAFPQLLLSNRTLKKMSELHHIDDKAMLEELRQIGIKMMSGQLPMPGNPGSQAGVGETRPQSDQGGQVGGLQSLMQTGGAEG
ncbi:hypothetical protein [Desulfobacter sp. UBA2225]|uniref:hypothetical protein n=1 Tax=Desulfobacter sp. UBA2225 TaxID=1961413 RepID=UPI00257FD278|nr:hypothetical protein [Desulfobacter sp. UBA2225]